jgi:copper chaperone CopZ
MDKVTYLVPGISCGHCVNTIEMEVGELDGVIGVNADPGTRQVVIEFQPPASESMLKDLLTEINYPIQED